MITDTTKQKEEAYKLKGSFRTFFEGIYIDGICDMPPIYEKEIPVSRMEITDITFDFKEEFIQMNITLCRPGILIGKGGHTIMELENYLNIGNAPNGDNKIKIHIIESNLWRRF